MVLDLHGVAGHEIVPLAGPGHYGAVVEALAQLCAVVHSINWRRHSFKPGGDLRTAVWPQLHRDPDILVWLFTILDLDTDLEVILLLVIDHLCVFYLHSLR